MGALDGMVHLGEPLMAATEAALETRGEWGGHIVIYLPRFSLISSAR